MTIYLRTVTFHIAVLNKGSPIIRWFSREDDRLEVRVSLTKILFIVLCVLFMAACSQEHSGITWPTRSWTIASPEDEELDQLALIRINNGIEAGGYGPIDRFLMIRNGRLVVDYTYEHDYELLSQGQDQTNSQYNYYHPDWHPYFRGSDLHTLQSVTKSITALVIGIAIQRGELVDTSEEVLPYFDDYEILNLDDRKRQITLEDLLTMRAGIEWDEMTYALDDPRNSVGELERSDDWIQFILDLPMAHQPGEVFVYSSGAAQLLSVIMEKATGLSIEEYAEVYLFEPLGISEYYWKKTPKGWADTEGGLYLKAENLAKLGYLVLHEGEWDGAQIISKEWVNEMLSPKVNDVLPDDPSLDWGYGYLWWLVGNTSQNGIDVYAGLGYGGQRLFVVPELDIVAVFNAWDIYMSYPSTIDLFLQQILPIAMGN